MSPRQVLGWLCQDVTGNDFLGRDRKNLPLAPYFGLWGGHFFQGGDGFLGAEFLVETDYGVQDDDGENRNRIDRFAQNTGDDPGHDQNPDDKTLELRDENLQRTDRFALFQLVRPIRRETTGSFLRR